MFRGFVAQSLGTWFKQMIYIRTHDTALVTGSICFANCLCIDVHSSAILQSYKPALDTCRNCHLDPMVSNEIQYIFVQWAIISENLGPQQSLPRRSKILHRFTPDSQRPALR